MSDEENNILDLIDPEQHFFNEGDILQDSNRGIRVTVLSTDRSSSVWYRIILELGSGSSLEGVPFAQEIEIDQEDLLRIFENSLAKLKLLSLDLQVEALESKRKIWEAYVG